MASSTRSVLEGSSRQLRRGRHGLFALGGAATALARGVGGPRDVQPPTTASLLPGRRGRSLVARQGTATHRRREGRVKTVPSSEQE